MNESPYGAFESCYGARQSEPPLGSALALVGCVRPRGLMHGNERRAELHRRDGLAPVCARRALLPLGVLALSACGKLEIGSYGATESDGGPAGSEAQGAGLGGMPAGAGE